MPISRDGKLRMVDVGFNQVALEIMSAWWPAPSGWPGLGGRSRALLLTGTGTVIDTAHAERIGLIDQVLPRSTFNEDWRRVAKALSARPAGEIKRVIDKVSPDEAVTTFARLWVDDAHWHAADRVMNRAAKVRGAT